MLCVSSCFLTGVDDEVRHNFIEQWKGCAKICHPGCIDFVCESATANSLFHNEGRELIPSARPDKQPSARIFAHNFDAFLREFSLVEPQLR